MTRDEERALQALEALGRSVRASVGRARRVRDRLGDIGIRVLDQVVSQIARRPVQTRSKDLFRRAQQLKDRVLETFPGPQGPADGAPFSPPREPENGFTARASAAEPPSQESLESIANGASRANGAAPSSASRAPSVVTPSSARVDAPAPPTPARPAAPEMSPPTSPSASSPDSSSSPGARAEMPRTGPNPSDAPPPPASTGVAPAPDEPQFVGPPPPKSSSREATVSATRPGAALIADAAFSPPDDQGVQDPLRLLVRDPTWGYVSWEIGLEQIGAAAAGMTRAEARLEIREVDASRPALDEPVAPARGHYFFRWACPGRTYRATLFVVAADGRRAELARSRDVFVPEPVALTSGDLGSTSPAPRFSTPTAAAERVEAVRGDEAPLDLDESSRSKAHPSGPAEPLGGSPGSRGWVVGASQLAPTSWSGGASQLAPTSWSGGASQLAPTSWLGGASQLAPTSWSGGASQLAPTSWSGGASLPTSWSAASWSGGSSLGLSSGASWGSASMGAPSSHRGPTSSSGPSWVSSSWGLTVQHFATPEPTRSAGPRPGPVARLPELMPGPAPAPSSQLVPVEQAARMGLVDPE